MNKMDPLTYPDPAHAATSTIKTPSPPARPQRIRTTDSELHVYHSYLAHLFPGEQHEDLNTISLNDTDAMPRRSL